MRLPDANKVSAKKKKEIAEARRALDNRGAGEVAAQLGRERSPVIAEESRKAKLASAAEMESRTRELIELQKCAKAATKNWRRRKKLRRSFLLMRSNPKG